MNIFPLFGIHSCRKVSQRQLISKNETYWFGLFSGFSFLLIIVISVALWDGGIDVDEDEVFRKIFPIFRGIGLIILYFFLLAWNVYGWTKYNVNYKLVFRFNHHYSQFSQVIRINVKNSKRIDSEKSSYILDNIFGHVALVFDFRRRSGKISRHY